jgi:hypothetical protein
VVDVLDAPREPIGCHFRRVNAFVAGARAAGGTVLVHCHGGVSRAAALVLAFLIAHEGMCFEDALARLRAARPIVDPNPGFVSQLREFEAQLREAEARAGASSRDAASSARASARACDDAGGSSSDACDSAGGIDPDTPDAEDEGTCPLLVGARRPCSSGAVMMPSPPPTLLAQQLSLSSPLRACSM